MDVLDKFVIDLLKVGDLTMANEVLTSPEPFKKHLRLIVRHVPERCDQAAELLMKSQPKPKDLLIIMGHTLNSAVFQKAKNLLPPEIAE